ncbi:MerR family transcriptional regulator [Paenibacillus ihuae]|uniref:MerR family transcriptional regulator n=1 Tax=Paenibacillus ihuae TaxID=1232431 RepID=UPI0006D53CBF|nr:MerR family transcriptional regulator [Paenibacillus ihuae]
MEKLYSIQDVSLILGIPKDTLRYYDRIGIVSPSRDDNRYRRYSKNDLIDLMNIQIMQYADFSLEEIKGKFGFHRLENSDPIYLQEVAAFFDAKNAVIREKIAHLEKVCHLLDAAAETLRDFTLENDQHLKEVVREMYQPSREKKPGLSEEECHGHQD